MEKPKLVCPAVDMNNQREKLEKIDIANIFTRQQAKTKKRFCNLTNLALLLTDEPMDYKDSVLPELFWKNQILKCLTFVKNSK